VANNARYVFDLHASGSGAAASVRGAF
jgi:hypothetical protein